MSIIAKVDLESDEVIKVWTDGSCYPANKGHGGWSFHAAFRGQSAERWGYQGGTTNNAMELRAIKNALMFVPASEKATRPLAILSDSAYAIGAVEVWHHVWRKDGWKTSNGSPVSNVEEIVKTVALLELHRRFRTVELVKVKGHAGIVGNERADHLAGIARKYKKTRWTPAKDIRTKLK